MSFETFEPLSLEGHCENKNDRGLLSKIYFTPLKDYLSNLHTYSIDLFVIHCILLMLCIFHFLLTV